MKKVKIVRDTNTDEVNIVLDELNRLGKNVVDMKFSSCIAGAIVKTSVMIIYE